MLEFSAADVEDGDTSTKLGMSELDSFEVESRRGLSLPLVPFAREETLAGVAFVGVGG